MLQLNEREQGKFAEYQTAHVQSLMASGKALQDAISQSFGLAEKQILAEREKSKELQKHADTMRRIFANSQSRQNSLCLVNAPRLQVSDANERVNLQTARMMLEKWQNTVNQLQAKIDTIAIANTASAFSQEYDTIKAIVTAQTIAPKAKIDSVVSTQKERAPKEHAELYQLNSAHNADKLRKDTAEKYAQLPAQFTCSQYKAVFGYNLNLSKLPNISKVA
jgi:hypothetical protein